MAKHTVTIKLDLVGGLATQCKNFAWWVVTRLYSQTTELPKLGVGHLHEDGLICAALPKCMIADMSMHCV